ncbi:MAG TPA: GntR family transcriptional regulator [Gaiella sp.]|nr:GntR family transcriptional regulator [Gaiella sp.]
MATVIPRTNLNEQVYDTLRRRILAREHGPGEKLSLHELAGELGVSRSPVHHALTRLVSEGLLTVKARRGYFVTPVTARALVEGYDVRLALESHAADVAVGTAADDQIAALRRTFEATAEAISHEEWDAANAAFHETQVDLAGNQLLSRFYRELSVNLMMQVIRGGTVERGEYLVTEHRAIVEALEARDAAAMRAAVAQHVESGRRIALEAVARAGGSL